MVKNCGKRKAGDLSDVNNLVDEAARLCIKDEGDVQMFDLVDLTDDDGLDGPDFIRELAPDSKTGAAPTLELPFGHVVIGSIKYDGVMLIAGMNVELYDGDFLKIKRIIRNLVTKEKYLQGYLLRRTRRIDDMLPKKLNEVCLMLTAHINGGVSSALCDSVVSRPLSDVFQVRRILITDRPFPALSWRESVIHFDEGQDVEVRGILVCRWKHIEYYEGRRVKESSLMHLREDECDFDLCKADVRWYADGTVRNLHAGSVVDLTEDVQHVKGGENPTHVDLTGSGDDDILEETIETTTKQVRKRIRRSGVYERRSTKVVTEQLTPLASVLRTHARSSATAHLFINTPKDYTYGDVCAGAGGMASGAVAAGLKVAFLLDHWEEAVHTLHRNFKNTRIFCVDIHDFCTNLMFKQYAKVAILHISFPCQPHSAVHTVPGKNDERNVASGYSVIPILQMCKPRVVTLEQTSGILTHRGGWHFRALVHQFTSVGYSVRWRIINCADYGNSQARKRLFIIAAAPGETLPPFTAPTHGTTGGLSPLTTIRDVLARVPRELEPHIARYTPKVGMPYADRTVLRQAITCDGGESDLHPTGTRSFSMQELAQLQGFPPEHKFVPAGMNTVRRLIGNAVPSCVAKAIFGEVVKSLRKSDDMTAAWKPEVVQLD